MQADLECEGEVRLGPLPSETRERLARFRGNWLEFAPEESAVVVRRVQPVGCPALSAVPCELVTILGQIPPEVREAMPGGALYVMGRSNDQPLRLLVERGEVRIQWAHPDYAHAWPVNLESAMGAANPQTARLNGWIRFGGSSAEAGQLQAFLDHFEGLYPEGDVDLNCERGRVQAQFKDVNAGPRELVAKLQEIANPPDSLEAELDVTSFAPGSVDQYFQLIVREGRIQALRPSLWKEA